MIQLLSGLSIAWRSCVFAVVFTLCCAVSIILVASIFPPFLALVAWLTICTRLCVRIAGYAACHGMLRHMRRAGWPSPATGMNFTQVFIAFPLATWQNLPPYEEVLMIPGLTDHEAILSEDDFRRDYFARHADAGRLFTVLRMLHNLAQARQAGWSQSPLP